MATDLCTILHEQEQMITALRTANRRLAARILEANDHARRGDIIIQGAMGVLRDHGYYPGPEEDLSGMIARVLRDRQAARQRPVKKA